MQEVKLPEIGEGVHEGELLKWLVKEGDIIEIDQVLAEILTDKASVEIPSTLSGTVQSLKAKEGDTIKVGEVIMTVTQAMPLTSTPSKDATAQKEVPPATPLPAKQTDVTHQGATAIPPTPSHILATPSTRRLALKLNVPIEQVSGTGNLGRVTKADVENFAKSTAKPTIEEPTVDYKLKKPQILQDEVVPLRGIRRKIAQRMQLSKQIIPHFSIMDEANVTDLVKIRTSYKEHFKNIKITYLPFIMKALIVACKDFPALNASIDEEKIIYKKNFHIGFAADTPEGLLVPVIKNADQKDILQMSQEIQHLAEKAKNGQLTLEEMTGSTITLTNIGSIGGSYATPIINPSEVAIIGLYRIQKKPLFCKATGRFQATDIMNLSCTADHRLIDGALAARFLRTLIKKIETPYLLMNFT